MRLWLHLKQEGAQIQANTARLAAIIAPAGAIGGCGVPYYVKFVAKGTILAPFGSYPLEF